METNNVLKERYLIGQVNSIIVSSSITIEVNILLLCFCSFDLFCPLLDIDISIKNLYIALSCPIK